LAGINFEELGVIFEHLDPEAEEGVGDDRVETVSI